MIFTWKYIQNFSGKNNWKDTCKGFLENTFVNSLLNSLFNTKGLQKGKLVRESKSSARTVKLKINIAKRQHVTGRVLEYIQGKIEKR